MLSLTAADYDKEKFQEFLTRHSLQPLANNINTILAYTKDGEKNLLLTNR